MENLKKTILKQIEITDEMMEGCKSRRGSDRSKWDVMDGVEHGSIMAFEYMKNILEILVKDIESKEDFKISMKLD